VRRRSLLVGLVVMVVAGVIGFQWFNAPSTLVKPAGDVLPGGIAEIRWHDTAYLLNGHQRDVTFRTTTPAAIEAIRQLVNGLLVDGPHPGRVCPADYAAPVLITLARRVHGPAFRTVSFQLGGCPHATVYLGDYHARAVYPSLVTSPESLAPTLAMVAAHVEQLIHDNAPPVR